MDKKYISAIDPTLKKRVLFIVHNGWAVSVVTGYKFEYKGVEKKQIKKGGDIK